ncbi:MAG: pyrroline-5-carboxylate reductase [Cyanobacteria bacterium SIG31]|nr:pyrroline-5-carboxylate reductase [Cyanobacteria bacterium SIG31]
MRGLRIMKKYNIGFIGCGKMASAIIKGITNSKFLNPDNIIATKSSTENLEQISTELKIKIILDNIEAVKSSDVIFVAVKPAQVIPVLEQIKCLDLSGKTFVSLAAGIKLEELETVLPQVGFIRVMPNTPVLVNEGMTGICVGKYVDSDVLDYVQSLFSSIGKSVVIEEDKMDILTAISGSGPAFFYKIINDIARAGESLGLDYEKALLLSIQTAIGSAKMAINRKTTMENLISNVATKGGCTRVGVDIMEEVDTAKIFAEVVSKTSQKASELGKS